MIFARLAALFALPIASGFMVATPHAVKAMSTPMSTQMRAPTPTPSPLSLAAASAFLATPSGQMTAVAAIFGGAYFAKRRADFCNAKDDGCDLVGGIMEDAAEGVDAISTLIGEEEKEEAEPEPVATAPDTSWRRSYS